MYKKTKILATVGPASDSLEVLEGLIKAGVNVFRLNFSHGTHEYHSNTLAKIREASKNTNIKVGVLQDICGPKVRVGKLESDFYLKKDDKVIFTKEPIEGKQISDNSYRVCINQPDILDMIKEDEYIYMCDGSIRAKVMKIDGDVVTRIDNDGRLASNKGVNFPNTVINIDVLTAVENLEEILKVSDGIMVARGDLGIEVPYSKVPTIQKKIIKMANSASKPVITATQMLLSMTDNDMATRAEISDVANAVLDGTDAVMLSEESAVGINPINVVEVMSNTIKETEKIYSYNKFGKFEYLDDTDIVTASVAKLARNLNTKAILSLTSSGKSAKKLARYRIESDIFAITHDERVARSLTICWGIKPIMSIGLSASDEMLSNAISMGVEKGFIDLDQTYIVTAGYPAGIEGSTNFLHILKREQLEYYLGWCDVNKQQ